VSRGVGIFEARYSQLGIGPGWGKREGGVGGWQIFGCSIFVFSTHAKRTRLPALALIYPAPVSFPDDGTNANRYYILTEMSGDSLMFDEFITLCDEQYEYGLIEFKNGDTINGPGENDGSAKVLSYAALANFDKDMTLKVSSDCSNFDLHILLFVVMFLSCQTRTVSWHHPDFYFLALGSIL
jgi:hypothetical protein